ncbi:hypothetical protein M0811_02195 [Anaeramoeba ignava]|uniref:Uncharacterized protein n=1 Tax=Anaeramoeba ignava TaxID=1746090 RepID=A0A9Q0LBY5_ANAIG|nr:hypothetical protein M0811_02195 [Anaeramoeba ignava]
MEKFFPDNLDNLEEMCELNGSTKPKKMKDKETNKIFVLKKGKSKEHCLNEFVANQIYEKANAQVPKMKKFETENDFQILIEFIDGITWKEYQEKNSKSPEKLEKIQREVMKHFVLDCLLANWDVAGLQDENIMIENSTEKPFRIDFGGALSYRAMGEKKKVEEWTGDFVPEIFTMLDSSFNETSARLFKFVSDLDIISQVNELNHFFQNIHLIQDLSDNDRNILTQRFQFLKLTAMQKEQDLYSTNQNFNADDDFDSQLEKALQESMKYK